MSVLISGECVMTVLMRGGLRTGCENGAMGIPELQKIGVFLIEKVVY